MSSISQLDSFRGLMEGSLPVVLKRDGTWYVENKIIYLIRWLCGFERQRLLNIARIVNESFYQMEINKTCKGIDVENWIKINQCVDRALANTWKNRAVIENRDLLLRHRLALALRSNKADLLNGVEDFALTDGELRDRLLALAKDWKSKQFNLKSTELTQEDTERLDEMCVPRFIPYVKILLKNQKMQDHLFKVMLRSQIDAAPLILFPGHFQKIEKCFMEMRISDKRRELCPLKVIESKKDDKRAYDLTLPFYTSNKKVEHISILDDKAKVELRGCFGEKVEENHRNRTYTIGEVFQEFKLKNKRVGNLEFLHFVGQNLEPAITLWDSHLLGYVDGEGKTHQIDADDPDYHQQLPLSDLMTTKEAKDLFEAAFVWKSWIQNTQDRLGSIPGLIDWLNSLEKTFQNDDVDWDNLKKEAAIRYKGHEKLDDILDWLAECKNYYRVLDGKRWIEYGAATRKDNGLHMLGTHALRVWVQPVKFNGENYYAKRDRGKYSDGDFPTTPIEFLKFFGGVHNATFEFPDTNNYYLNRYLTFYSILIQDPENVKKGLERLRKKILLSREGKACFQYQSNGCGKEVQDDINMQRELVGLKPLNPFYIRNKKTRPPGIIGFLHSFAKPFPVIVHKSILYSLGAWKRRTVTIDGKEVDFSYYGSQAWVDQKFHLPASLHYRQIKELKRKVKKYPISLLPKKLPPFLELVAKGL